MNLFDLFFKKPVFRGKLFGDREPNLFGLLLLLVIFYVVWVDLPSILQPLVAYFK